MRSRLLRVWVLCWLMLVWVLLWGKVSPANIIGGLAVALVITLLLPLPAVPVEGRVHPLSLVRLIVVVAYQLVLSSLQVAWLAIRPGPPPLTAVLRARLSIKSDLVLALAVNIFNLIPGSMVLEIDQERRLIYVHVIDVGNEKAVDRFYRQIAQIGAAAGVHVRARRGLAARDGEGGIVNTVWIIAAVMLTAAAVIVMFRILAGPSTLDRIVALDTLVAVTMCAIGTWAAFSLDTTVTYSLTALALISFVGSVSVARFRVPDIRRNRKSRYQR